jgi:hypothetical protein
MNLIEKYLGEEKSDLPNRFWAIVKTDKIVHSGNDVGMTMDKLSDMAKKFGGTVIFGDKSLSKAHDIGNIFGYTWQQIDDMQHKRR